MKSLLLAFALVSLSGLASASDCSEVSTRIFSATTSSGRLDNSCSIEDADTLAKIKCKRAGYMNCKRLPGYRGAQVTDTGFGSVCTVTVQGEIVIGTECAGN